MQTEWPIMTVMSANATHPNIVDAETARKIYRDMVLLRTFDERAVNLQRQGRIGTYPPSMGQEASEVASAHALKPQDWVVPSYRDHGASYVHGVPFENIILFAMGRIGDLAADVRVLPSSIPISTHLPHAVGLAMASRVTEGADTVAMAYFGDGGTSEGDFHEALNFAGVFKAPVIFFCQNNGWAISVPVTRQTASATLAQKAAGYGIAGIRVDGNDALAVYMAVAEARQRAVDGLGPTLIEAVTYRIGPHTTSDDPTRYRPVEELEAWQEKEPIQRLQAFLEAQGWLSADEARQMAQETRDWVNRAVEEAEARPPADPWEMFHHVYATLPPRLTRQYQEFLRGRE